MVVVNVGPLGMPMAYRRSDGHITEILWRNVQSSRCRDVVEWVHRNPWKGPRNMHEARRAAQVADELMRTGYPLSGRGDALEMLMRTVAGLYMSDLHEDVSLLEELEWCPPQALVPRDVVRSVLKDAKRKQQLQPASRGAGKS